ncbi:DUF4326 domain-containing protein [Ruegeria atlantica]|uniref:DUF4326 domain-containing protein n=1 Tax=Ruegeria atlantica TaxID=81569 RepID=UPI00147A7EF6|nr:DUF4326 domain-containing protein [Ruegeria atlantica]
MTDHPRRIQLQRTKGWRKPDNTTVVARPGPWGNPFKVGVHGDAEECVRKYRRLLGGLIDVASQPCPSYAEQSATLDHVREQIHTLRGRNLGCWCKLDQPCHAAVLLKLANGSKS